MWAISHERYSGMALHEVEIVESTAVVINKRVTMLLCKMSLDDLSYEKHLLLVHTFIESEGFKK